MRERVGLEDNAGRVPLFLNYLPVPQRTQNDSTKCSDEHGMDTRREDKVMIRREEVKGVEEFVYLSATVTKEGGGTEDNKKRQD